MIEFSCSHCGQTIRVRDESAGKAGKCKSCGETVTVPRAADGKQHLRRQLPPKPSSSDEIQAIADVPMVRPPIALQVNVPRQSKWSNSLGIASIVLGILAFLICWIPFIGVIGMPLSALGLILGLCGGLVAVTRRFAGIGFPIAGTAVSALALIISISVTYATGKAIEATAKTIDESFQKATETNQLIVGDNVEQTSDRAAGVDEWADASNAVQQGDVRVKVQTAYVDHVSVETLFGDVSTSKDKLLQIELLIENISDSKKIEYRSWAGSGFLDMDAASLEDDLGNRYKRVDFGVTNKVKGQVLSESIYPEKSINDLLVFETPVERASFVKLELPAKAFGGEGVLRLKIPVDWNQSLRREPPRDESPRDQGAGNESVVSKARANREKQGVVSAADEPIKTEQEPPDTEQDVADTERKAASKLKLAKNLLERGNKLGEKWLQEIVEDYPETDAAQEAQQLLNDRPADDGRE